MTAEPSNLSSADLADRYGVTTLTIGNYVKRGMPVIEGSKPRKFDPVECDKWLASNRDHEGQFANSSPGKGGKREGSGRPKGSGLVQSESGDKYNVKMAVTSADLLELVRSGVTPTEIAASKQALALLKEVTEYEKEAGLLVNAEEAADFMRLVCVGVRERMLQVAPCVAAKAGELKLSQADAVRLRTITEEVVSNALESSILEVIDEALAKWRKGEWE